MSTRDLVNAIVAGDAASIEVAFQSVMAEKISDSLESYRQEVAKSMFKTEQVELSEEKHRVQVTVSEPDHPSVSMRKATKQKFIRLSANDEVHAVQKAKAHYKKQGYKVHDAEHVGMVKEEVEQISEAPAGKTANHTEMARLAHQAYVKATSQGNGPMAAHYMQQHLRHKKLASAAKKANVKEEVELDEEQLDELDKLAMRGMFSADPKSKQHVGVTTEKGKAARAKANLPVLKQVIARSIGKHPKPNLPEEVEIQIEQLEVSNVESALYALEEGRNVLDQALAEAVSSDSKNRYEYTNGKKPSGRGNWMFSTVHPREHDVTKHKDQTVSVQGTFADAAKKAASHFKEKGHKGEIHVLS